LGTITGSDATYARIFEEAYSFAVGSITSSNGTLEANPYDTVIVTWTNPFDGSDVVYDTVYVYPADVAARVYFSTSSSLNDTVSAFSEAATPVYVIVMDQDLHADSSYSATLTTASGESETISLSISGNTLVGSIPANYTVISSGDNILQINLAGEQITASYTDPLYPTDSDNGFANYAARTVYPPTADPVDGTWFANDTVITLMPDSSADSIIYTLDNSTPALTSGMVSSGTLYSGPISISANTILKAMSYQKHDAANYAYSTVFQANYYKRDSVRIPSADPPTTYFTEDTLVVLIPNVAGDTIYYTTDGSDPTAASTMYTGVISILDTTTLKFFAVNGTSIQSPIVTEVYTERDTLAIPVANPPTTTFLTDTTVTLSHPDVPTAVIRYTLDGTDPDETSTVYSGPLTFRELQPHSHGDGHSGLGVVYL
jgi:hypothetical protein